VVALDLAASAGQLLGALVDLPLAHPLDYPHQEPAQSSDEGGTSPILIGGGVVLTIVLAGGLFWVRERVRRADESAALEGGTRPEADQQHPGGAVEPADQSRPREEPA
jgi:hypothetical protein